MIDINGELFHQENWKEKHIREVMESFRENNKSEIIVLRGISGSGKSTYAHNLWKENPQQYVIINRDKIRELAFGYTETTIKEYYTRQDFSDNEKTVTTIQNNFISVTLNKGKTPIIDNTNLRLKYVDELNEIAKQFNVELKVIDFDIEVDEAIFRDSKRTRQVGVEIIKQQYSQLKNRRWKAGF